MKGELEFTQEELNLLETPQEFSVFLESLHEEYDLYDLTELYDFFYYQNKIEHCEVIHQFKVKYNLFE